MPVLLARHHEILNQSIQAHNGFVFQIVGDSFAAAFHSASDALDAALEAQRLIHQEASSRTQFQLTVAGLFTTFPPLKTLDIFPNNLPVQLTTLVGRENETNCTKIRKEQKK